VSAGNEALRLRVLAYFIGDTLPSGCTIFCQMMNNFENFSFGRSGRRFRRG
jgi:hypothetical protein